MVGKLELNFRRTKIFNTPEHHSDMIKAINSVDKSFHGKVQVHNYYNREDF